MALYAEALRDLGRFLGPALGARPGGGGRRLGRAPGLVARARNAFFDDRGFYKRAQIVPNDLALAGVAEFADLDRLTIFADNLVPHVLRVDGVLRYDPGWRRRSTPASCYPPGEAEREIRACAVHACELIAERIGTPPRVIDVALWNRGQAPRYKAIPRHRTRSDRLLLARGRRGRVRLSGCLRTARPRPGRGTARTRRRCSRRPRGRSLAAARWAGRVLVTERVTVHRQPGAMSAPDEAGRPARAALGLERHHVVLRGPHPVGVAGDPASGSPDRWVLGARPAAGRAAALVRRLRRCRLSASKDWMNTREPRRCRSLRRSVRSSLLSSPRVRARGSRLGWSSSGYRPIGRSSQA